MTASGPLTGGDPMTGANPVTDPDLVADTDAMTDPDTAGGVPGRLDDLPDDGRWSPDARRVGRALAALGVDARPEPPDAFLLTLPGERRYRTLVWLLVGTHELLVESFVCRRPDENADGVHRFLLQRNARLRSVAYAIDADGDIHLVGRVGLRPLADPAVLADELDTVLGVVLSTSDEDFNQILERGFAGAIRREWAWRTERGYAVKNLQAFRHLIGPDATGG
ncbi:YbjN domain-containing protein [Nakamurella endophytica]|uniref:Sensory transduction regulator n=1 Tax=Nakamurella endophytica TaxID=1748367 RepID=A0A917TC86_9ACTN|nr:YbjN domain-containing protein [Nakamurella endophytica]GGM15290.1 hypothetical protein GCM10011594_39110 [Nakamurella endophytica]